MAAVLRRSLWLIAPDGPTVADGMDNDRDRYSRDFGGNLVYLRAQAGVTSQAALAALVGVHESTVQRWEAGKALPDAWELRVLAREFGVELDELVNPEPLSDRERTLLRRSTRAARTAARAR